MLPPERIGRGYPLIYFDHQFAPGVTTTVKEVRARAPASSANLGPGFDTLALALSLHVEVEVEEAPALLIRAEGEGSDLPADETHLAAQVARRVLGHDRVAIHVRSDVPVGRGLGSSAALAVATAAAAGAPDPLVFGSQSDGHPENAAASVLGGLVTATTVDGRPVAARLPLDEALAFVLLVPDRQLATKRARDALPALVPHGDATFNLGRMGLLLAGLADHRRLVQAATDDRLHQPARAPLFPEAACLLAGLVEAGALAACWSGAGPSLLGVCTAEAAPEVRARADKLLAESKVGGVARVLGADLAGLIVTS
ncbi:MAG: homoserine kinase [Actinobacteria bacterium]|nr:MAG: homoserine kinase [Actinomycetota bacterium]